MIKLWCARRSLSLRLLVKEINKLGVDAKCNIGGPKPPGALVWGGGGGNKYIELAKLKNAGVPVPDFFLDPPMNILYFARKFKHHEANDLRQHLKSGDYYTEYVHCLREHRVHIFDGKCVRVQQKVPRCEEPNPIIRSWVTGWKLECNPHAVETLPPKARLYAKQAVAALKYTFGAVDIGTRYNTGEAIVWEVNSQPGLEGGTLACYARAIIRTFGE